MKPDIVDFKFPSFFTAEEEAFSEEIEKSMGTLYNSNDEEKINLIK